VVVVCSKERSNDEKVWRQRPLWFLIMHLGRLKLRKESTCECTDMSYCSCVILLLLLSSCIDLVEVIAFELLGFPSEFLIGSSKRRKLHL
jgi:hypothetical protein